MFKKNAAIIKTCASRLRSVFLIWNRNVVGTFQNVTYVARLVFLIINDKNIVTSHFRRKPFFIPIFNTFRL